MANQITQSLIDELGLSDLPEESKQRLLSQMTESVLKRITIRVLEQLSEADREEFDKIGEAGDADKMDAFLKAKIPNYEQMLQEVIGEFREEMKANVDALK